MEKYQEEYYQKMMEKDRLIPIMLGDKMVGFITYYIGSSSDTYVRENPWSVLDDNPETGSVCFIDQMITNKDPGNHKYSRKVWRDLKNFILTTYPKVKVIRWNRVKQGVPHVYLRALIRKQVQQASV